MPLLQHTGRTPRVGVIAVGAIAALFFLVEHTLGPWRPDAPRLDQGWWSFTDQGRYLQSTLAWAAGNLDPAEHWYAPGYPLLAEPFVGLSPADPFLLPDLALLLLSLWLTAMIAARLAPGWRHAELAGALVFLATSVLPPDVLTVWVIPWTTTPTTAATLACILATLHVLDSPVAVRSWRPLLMAAVAAACIPAFRPSDGAVVMAVCGTAIAMRLIAARAGPTMIVRVVTPALIGAASVLAAAVALHWLVHGAALGPYLEGSAEVGFEWRILPLQWVQIMLAARPLLPESNGLVARMPWIMPGLAGMLACLLTPPWGARRRGHVFVIGLATLHVMQYLAYRDLHPPGLWRHLNYHYFKWLFPIFGYYALPLCAVLVRHRRVGLAAILTVVVVAIPWRVELAPLSASELAPPNADGSVAIPAGLGVWDAMLVPGDGSWDAVYHGDHSYRFGTGLQQRYGFMGHLVAYQVPSGVMLVPMSPLPAGPGLAVLDKRVTPRLDRPTRVVRQRIVYGVPCFLSSRLYRIPICQAAGPLE